MTDYPQSFNALSSLPSTTIVVVLHITSFMLPMGWAATDKDIQYFWQVSISLSLVSLTLKTVVCTHIVTFWDITDHASGAVVHSLVSAPHPFHDLAKACTLQICFFSLLLLSVALLKRTITCLLSWKPWSHRSSHSSYFKFHLFTQSEVALSLAKVFNYCVSVHPIQTWFGEYQ